MTSLDLNDIQGLILRGYRKDLASHLVLQIERQGDFKAKLRDLADEDSESGPFITVAEDWTSKPPVWQRNGGDQQADRWSKPTHCINIGFTFEGLRTLGLGDESLQSFPVAFREGAVRRAGDICETELSAPEHWEDSLGSGDAHAIVSVYADTREELAHVMDEICRDAGATRIAQFDAQRLGGTDVEHFGYVDGLSQPTIAGAPMAGIKDPFPRVKAGEFVLGQPTQRDKPWDPVPVPDELGRNGSFAAFRVMSQDVEAFEDFLTTESERAGIDRELLAAKLCGRWRNGEPLVMRPPSVPAGTIPRENLNAFDYEATKEFPADDHEGLLCPRGAHIRRAFPRSQRVVDDSDGLQRRIVRRGMPYDWELSDGCRERGIVGMFICASLENQFEYVMRHWINDSLFTGGRLGRAKDPMIGANDPADSRFATPGTPRVEAKGFPRFVTTRGCAYLFLPSMRALRYMAGVD